MWRMCSCSLHCCQECFYDQQLLGISVKALNTSTQESKMLCQWIEKGVFDALNSQFLERIVLAVYQNPEDERSLMECYTFHVNYMDDDGVFMSLEHSRRTRQKDTVTKVASSHTKVPTKVAVKEATSTFME